jgi:Uri superfamily endonuclease
MVPMIECGPHELPTEGGAYVLEFELQRRIVVDVGALGRVAVGPGGLRYYGSARGPGGLGARISRHLNPRGRRDRWHVDALTRTIPVDRIWIDFERTECRLVADDLESGLWMVVVPGFGSSDCRRCPAHLLAARR